MSGQTNEDAAAAAGRESPARHIELVEDEAAHHENGAPSPALTDSKGWDGKLRVDRTAQLQNPEAISDPEYSDDENVLPGESVPADEGWFCTTLPTAAANATPLLIMTPSRSGQQQPANCALLFSTNLQTFWTMKTPKPMTLP